MSYADVYIGSLEDKTFDWDDSSGDGLCPVKRSSFFPGRSLVWGYVVDKIIQDYQGKQHDWGSWIGKATKQQIKELIQNMYSSDWYIWLDNLLGLKKFVEKLDPKKQYALVASEL